MKEKILYYLGAGASAGVLPLAKTIWSNSIATVPPIPRIAGLIYALEHFGDQVIGIAETHGDKEILEEISKRSKDLALAAAPFGDIDTYAKYLNIKDPGGNELKTLKQTLSQYFAIKQLVLKARDSRYLPWLVSIMNRKVFPDTVKILSWNYDFQVQLAASEFGFEEDINHDRSSFVYSPSPLVYYPNLDPTFREFQSLSLVHLNGIAGYGKDQTKNISSIFQQKNKSSINTISSFLFNTHLHELLHFAWDNTNYHNELMAHVKSMIQGTTIMVVIGYSFPFFNRGVDKEVFSELLKDMTFRKIYFQDPVLDGKQLIGQFNLPDYIDIQSIKQTDNFHVPFEY